MPTPKKKLFLCTVDTYCGGGSSLTEAYENLRDIVDDAQSPNDSTFYKVTDCTFYEATPIQVKMELIPTLTKD